ncbi:MAG: NAD(P)/FAD-dependent oxidoreductase [Verrucomicrobiota bacterium]
MNKYWDCIVIGGGAAGMFAAITCKETNPKKSVCVLEKAPRFLTKVGISGGGRCNVTHACFDPRELVSRYPRGSRELRGPFSKWQPSDTIDWFEQRGVELKTEDDGRIFPTTDDSQTIINLLLESARDVGVSLFSRQSVLDVRPSENGVFEICSKDQKYSAQQVMLATGSLKDGPLAKNLQEIGHSIQELAPSLFTFKINDPRINELQGIAIEPTKVNILDGKLENTGPVLITHWGLSGPGILKLSAVAARELQKRQYVFKISLNWLADFHSNQVVEILRRARRQRARQQVGSHALFSLPQRFWDRIIQSAHIPRDTVWSQLKSEQEKSLIRELTEMQLSVSGKSMNKEEFVTCGGVTLKEVDFRRMESRIIPNLYFGGEVLDIDGITGGFNLQNAWTTGRLAGLAMAAPSVAA